jgi:hypothetical protein
LEDLAKGLGSAALGGAGVRGSDRFCLFLRHSSIMLDGIPGKKDEKGVCPLFRLSYQ